MPKYFTLLSPHSRWLSNDDPDFGLRAEVSGVRQSQLYPPFETHVSPDSVLRRVPSWGKRLTAWQFGSFSLRPCGFSQLSLVDAHLIFSEQTGQGSGDFPRLSGRFGVLMPVFKRLSAIRSLNALIQEKTFA